MNQFLLYVVQSALCLSLFYGLYLLLLRRETFFRFNRSVLLAIMIASMTIPLIRIPVAEPALVQLPVMQLEEMWISIETAPTIIPEMVNQGIQTPVISVRTTFNVIPLAYFAGFFVSLALALVSFISVARIIVTARRVVFRQQRILVSPFQISSFTFAGWIVLSEMDYERFAAEIITHETIHRRNGHFWDLCLVNAIAVVHWFNPLIWLLRREMKTLHEYETDRRTLNQGIDATRYQLLLIEKAAGASRYSVASSFAQSKIKKRIVMMNKQNPNPWARWKALLFIPLAALLVQCFARPEINRELEQISTLKSTEILQESEGIILPIFFRPNYDSEPSDIIPERSKTNFLFFPHGFKNPRKYLLTIYSRFGQKIFETTDPKRGWNGYFEGNLCDEGVYMYKVDGIYENGQPFSKTGTVTLVPPLPTVEEIRKRMREESEEIFNRQITLNGKTMKLKDINSELPEQYRMKEIWSTSTQNVRFGIVDKDTYKIRWRLNNFILNEQWITDAEVDLRKIVSINTYPADEAVKRYGSNAKDGVIAITTEEEWEKAAEVKPLPISNENNTPLTSSISTDITITGMVATNQGRPLRGANVSIKGSDICVVTDIFGGYQITVPNADAVLQFSNLGYFSSEISVGNQQEINIVLSEDEGIVTHAENMPLFNGKAAEQEFRDYINRNTVYPRKALENGIGGRVLVSFIIDEDGSLVNAKVIRGIDPLLDAEALRVVKSSPQWTPGKQNGKAVKVKIDFPVMFKYESSAVVKTTVTSTINKQPTSNLQNHEDIIIPNQFKPIRGGEPSDMISDIGDKSNLFFPSLLSPVNEYYFVVYTRWGKKIFETTDPNRGWNGYFESRLCDEGVYFYIIKCVFETGQSSTKKGDVTLLR